MLMGTTRNNGCETTKDSDTNYAGKYFGVMWLFLAQMKLGDMCNRFYRAVSLNDMGVVQKFIYMSEVVGAGGSAKIKC